MGLLIVSPARTVRDAVTGSLHLRSGQAIPVGVICSKRATLDTCRVAFIYVSFRKQGEIGDLEISYGETMALIRF